MGCCQSSFVAEADPVKLRSQLTHLQSPVQPPTYVGNSPDPIDIQSFSEFPFSDLTAATNNFSSDLIISESGEKAPNIVYKGQLQNKTWIAVKKFSTTNWPNPEQFKEEAICVGRLRHRRLANLIGYCCDDDQRLLVAEYIPNHTLAKHLFLWEDQTMEWAMRLRTALYVAEALRHCDFEGRPLYHGLNAYRVLFDEGGDPRLSCFGLIKRIEDGESEDEEIYRKMFGDVLAYPPLPFHSKKARVTPENVIYDFGALLLKLLSGKNIPPNHGLDMIQGKNVIQIMDPYLEGQYSTEEATTLVNLASRCLQDEPTHRPKFKVLVETLSSLQKKTDVPSSVMLGLNNQYEALLSLHRPLSSMGEACSRKDLTAIHQLLVAAHYRDDERSRELSFQEWTEQMRDMLEARKRGDYAFRDKNFNTAIEYYSQFIKGGSMVSPTVFARRSLCFLLCDQPDAALRDGMEAQVVSPDWPTAFYMQSVALAKLDMHKDAADMLNEAAALEDNQQRGGQS